MRLRRRHFRSRESSCSCVPLSDQSPRAEDDSLPERTFCGPMSQIGPTATLPFTPHRCRQHSEAVQSAFNPGERAAALYSSDHGTATSWASTSFWVSASAGSPRNSARADLSSAPFGAIRIGLYCLHAKFPRTSAALDVDIRYSHVGIEPLVSLAHRHSEALELGGIVCDGERRYSTRDGIF